MKKNDLCTITIHGYTAEGMGVGRTDDGMAVFVPGAAREDKLQVRLVKVLKNYAFGKIEEIVEPSPYRIAPDCPVFGKCGGCDFRHLTYEEELWLKARRVHDAMTRIGGFDLSVPDVTGSPDIEGYRNKAQFPVGLGENGMNYGFFRSRSHQLIPLEGCKLQSEEACALAEAVCRWADQCKVKPYDETAHAGLLRHIYVRQGRAGLHLTLVVLRDKLPREDLLVEICREAVPALCGIVVNVNPDRGNRVLGLSCRTLWGDERLEDDLMGNTFRLSPLSFYQVNHRQTENLYACAAQWASPDGDTEALDLYCGVGTITLTLAGHCKSVVGVEIVPAAIEDAKENAARNGIENVRFLCADAGQAAAKMAAEGFRPGVIVVDPPRKGLDEAAVKALCDMSPDRIVYVSCDCASLARDAKMLFTQGGYRPTKVQAFDMFPRTANIETVVLLSKGEIDSKKIRVEFSLEDIDTSGFQQGATYEQIKGRVLEQTGLKVSSLYISQIKRKCGLEVGQSYNLSKKENAKQPQCPPEKEKAIREAMKYFGMI